MCILNGGLVKLSKVNTEAQLAILLLHHDYGGCPRIVRGADNATLWHLLYLLGLLLPHSRVLLVVGKPHKWSLCLDRVLEHRGLPKVLVIMTKRGPILLQQLFQLSLLYWLQLAGNQLAKG